MKNIAETAPRAGIASEGVMVLSEEDVAALRAELEKAKREVGAIKAKIRDVRRSSRGFGENGRGAHPSTGKAVVIQLIVEELLLRLWVPCGHVG